MSYLDVNWPARVNFVFMLFRNIYGLEDNEEKTFFLAAILDF